MTLSYAFHIDERAVADAGDELAIQIRIKKAVHRRLDARFVAIPNGMKTTGWAALKAKSEGLSKGFPDSEVLWADGGRAYVEVKSKDGGLSDDQVEWLNWLVRNGHRAGVFRSVETCIAWLIEQGAPLKFGALAA